MRARSPQNKVVVLVDALDELRYHDTKDNILHWLTGCPIGDLPENVRFVLTSRPPDQALNLFCDTHKPNLDALVLALDEGEKTRADVRKHLQADAQVCAARLVVFVSPAPYWPSGREPTSLQSWILTIPSTIY